MIYLYGYLGIGACVVLSFVIFHTLAEEKDNRLAKEGLVLDRPKRQVSWDRIVDDVIGPALGMLLIIPFWPVIVFLKLKELIFGEAERKSLEEPEFAVTREDLQTQLTLAEAERREMVFDPLGAVPNVPFGHLNAVWKKFIEDIGPDGCLWSFTADWTTSWGCKEMRQGYVIVRGDEIGPHFLTIWRDADEESIPGKAAGDFDTSSRLRKLAD